MISNPFVDKFNDYVKYHSGNQSAEAIIDVTSPQMVNLGPSKTIESSKSGTLPMQALHKKATTMVSLTASKTLEGDSVTNKAAK